MQAQVLSKMAPPVNETLEILEKVNNYYDSAWNKLIITGSVIIAVVGVVVPLLIQWWQKKNIQLSEEALDVKMKDKFSALQVKLKDEIRAEYQSEITRLGLEVKKYKAEAKANAMFLQAASNFDLRKYKIALGDFSTACNLFITATEWLGVQDCLINIHACLENITKKDYEEYLRVNNVDLSKILKIINHHDDTKLLSLQIDEIKEKMFQLKGVKENEEKIK